MKLYRYCIILFINFKFMLTRIIFLTILSLSKLTEYKMQFLCIIYCTTSFQVNYRLILFEIKPLLPHTCYLFHTNSNNESFRYWFVLLQPQCLVTEAINLRYELRLLTITLNFTAYIATMFNIWKCFNHWNDTLKILLIATNTKFILKILL